MALRRVVFVIFIIIAAAIIIINLIDFNMPENTVFKLARRPTVFCLILTHKSNINKRNSVIATWASECNDHAFVLKTDNNETFPFINTPIKEETRENLFKKTLYAMTFLNYNYTKKYDFYFKADDDTFVIVDNLKEYLSTLDSTKKLITGRRFKPFVKSGYYSGGAGYVLSRPALEAIVKGSQEANTTCIPVGSEDVGIGKCAETYGVTFLDSRDRDGYERFHPLSTYSTIFSEHVDWLNRYNYYPMKKGMNCCSENTISFHYVKPEQMYIMHLFAKRIRR